MVARFGRQDQQSRWLRRLATGASIGVFALSEENAGTDAANQETVAIAEGAGWRLSGRKVWVANAAAADLGIVFAATQPGARGRGITAFLIPLIVPASPGVPDPIRWVSAASDAWTCSSTTCTWGLTTCWAK